MNDIETLQRVLLQNKKRIITEQQDLQGKLYILPETQKLWDVCMGKASGLLQSHMNQTATVERGYEKMTFGQDVIFDLADNSSAILYLLGKKDLLAEETDPEPPFSEISCIYRYNDVPAKPAKIFELSLVEFTWNYNRQMTFDNIYFIDGALDLIKQQLSIQQQPG